MNKIVEKKVVKKEEKVATQRERVKELLTLIDQNWFDLALELENIYNSWVYKEWGYEDFRGYTEKDLQIEYRIAMYRVAIAKAIKKYNIKKEEVVELGWTKFTTIIPFLTDNKKQREELIKKAKKLTVKELQIMLKPKGGEKNEGHKYIFTFNDDQQKIILQALKMAEILLKTTDKNRLVEAIISEWLSTHI